MRIEQFPIETGLATTGVDIRPYSTKYHSKDVFKEVYQRAISKISFWPSPQLELIRSRYDIVECLKSPAPLYLSRSKQLKRKMTSSSSSIEYPPGPSSIMPDKPLRDSYHDRHSRHLGFRSLTLARS